VGFGVFSGMKDEDWEYEYKAGNEEAKLKYGSNADLALIGMSEAEVAEDMVKVCLLMIYCSLCLFVLLLLDVCSSYP